MLGPPEGWRPHLGEILDPPQQEFSYYKLYLRIMNI